LIKQINILLEQLHNPLNSKKEKIAQLTGAQQLLQQLQQKTTELQKQEQTKQQLIKKTVLIEEDIKAIQQKIEEIRKTGEWEHYTNLREREKELKSAQEKVLEQLNRQITPLVKLLKRLEKQNKSQRHTLTDAHRQTLTQLLNAPQKAKNTQLFLEYLKKLLLHDTLGINPQKIDKITTHLNYLLQSNKLEELQAEYNKTTLELTNIKKVISESNVTKKIDDLDRIKTNKKTTLNRLQSDISSCEKRIEQLEDEKKQFEGQIQQTINTISKGTIVLSNN
jgi:DNA repair exonuclease SbcCD ATPase subunit